MNLPSEQPMQFSDEEIQNLKEIFDLFDKQNEGAILVSDLDAIMQSLQRDPQEAKDLLQNIRNQNPNQTDHQRVSFDEFIQLMQHVENKLAKDDPNGNQQMDWNKNSQGIISITADNKVLDFLRLLEEYRKKCEIEGNYQEAKKAAGKFEELLRKETIRQKNNIRAAQEQELQNIEAA
jgi:Ca2+-binding EF-hand superfamily protein